MDDEDFNLNYAIGGWKYGTTPTMQAAAYAAISNGGKIGRASCRERV